MKRVPLYALLPIFFLFLFLAGCIPGITDHLGTVTSSLEVSGYAGGTDTSVLFTVDKTDGEGYISRSIPADSSNYAEGRFQELEPGMWDLTAAFMDGSTAVDSHTVAVEGLPGETSSVTITGTYESATDSITFIDSVSISGSDTAIEFTDMNAVIVEERRMWDDSATDPDMWTQVTAPGSFGSAIGGSVLFPDGTLLDIATSRSFGYSYRVDDTEMWASRSTGNDEIAGTYTVSLYDINHTTRSGTYEVDVDLNEASAPNVTFPTDGGTFAGGAINWNHGSVGHITYTYVFGIEDYAAPVWHANEIPGVAVTDTTAPTVPGLNYELFILFTDTQISPAVYGEITANADGWNGIITRILRDYDSDIDYVGVARLNVTGS